LRLKQFLQEEYVASFESNSTFFDDYSGEPIFMNPTSKEITETGRPEVRLCLDLIKKRLFIWDYDIIHSEIIDFLNRKNILKNYNNLLLGKGMTRNGKIEYFDDETTTESFKRFYKKCLTKDYDDRWMKQWFSITPIEKYKTGNLDL
jgi:hypothetical protein